MRVCLCLSACMSVCLRKCVYVCICLPARLRACEGKLLLGACRPLLVTLPCQQASTDSEDSLHAGYSLTLPLLDTIDNKKGATL